MDDIGVKAWYSSTWRVLGAAVLLFFGLKLLLCLHLGLIGRAVSGHTGTPKGDVIPDASEPVLYVYFPEGASTVPGHQQVPPHGWRRGLQWGGQEVTVVYSPFISKIHVVSTTPGILRATALWGEIDYLLRVALLLCGTVVGLGMVLFGDRFPTSLPKGWHFLHGLHEKPTT